MPVLVRDNERSWAIELISEINRICSLNDWKIKKAGGERTISSNRKSMFPDLILFGDENRNVILQGWEIKMPDVPIENEEFIRDAQRKALALNLNSCVTWNFSYVVLYIKNADGTFKKAKVWNSTAHIRTRADVATYVNDWKNLLDEVLTFINGYLLNNTITTSSLGKAISDTVITELINRNKTLVSNHLRAKVLSDSSVGAMITLWWMSIRYEYSNDENNEYDAYAKTIILSWATRILFAHIIKTRQNMAQLIDAFSFGMKPEALNKIFDSISSRCDFYNIFKSIPCDELIPDETWQDLSDFSMLMKNNSIVGVDQSSFQNILEETVAKSRRELNGQYTTPELLCEILLRITVKKWDGLLLDCCCGTGTIPQKAISIKKSMMPNAQAIKQVWASDKYDYPLQVANISMSRPDTINLANYIFKHNALDLFPGNIIYITNPATGSKDKVSIPAFDSIVSNLPFIPFEHIPQEDKDIVSASEEFNGVDSRSDLYSLIALHLDKLLAPGGRIGIITSNSWLASNEGSFLKALQEKYNVLQVHISGNGKWFKNADVVTTLIILEEKNGHEVGTSFVIWRKSLDDLKDSLDDKEKHINGIIMNQNLFPDLYTLTTYSKSTLNNIHDMHVSYNSFFHDVSWLPSVFSKLIPLKDTFKVFRGSRRGWDALFYPTKGTHSIESQFIQPVIINARNINTLTANAFEDAFCCDKSIEELNKIGASGALDWISKFEHQVNGVGKPLPQVLAKRNAYWYQLERNEIAELFTMMNPDKRFFYCKCDSPSFINQRLIGLTRKNEEDDLVLLHALLNSVISYFYIEANGFGRGLGVLDITKDNIEKCMMLNPALLNQNQKQNIINKFAVLKQRPILNILEELTKADRLEFEKEVFKSFGIGDYLPKVISSFTSMIKTRDSVKNK